MSTWLAEVQNEAHDHYGALSVPVGIALVIGGPVLTLLDQVRWLGWIFFLGLLVAALWVGHDWERSHSRALGRGRARETLLRRSTWLIVGWCLFWSLLLLALAHARGWHAWPGWRDAPILLMLLLATYHLTVGLMLLITRWLIIGLVIALLAVLIPGVNALRGHIWLVTGLLVGLTLMLSGIQGRQILAKRVRGAG